MSRTNNVTFENVFAQNASTAIPSQPITGVSYRDDTQTAEQIETGQAYDSIYNSARYNQLFYQMTSLLADMAKNGLLPFQTGQHYLQGARVLDGGLIYIANREILASEQPYPSPNIDSQAWTPAVATSSDLGGDGASDQAVPSQKAVKTYVDDNFLPLSGGVINGDLATNGQYFAIKADFAKGTVPDTNRYYQLSVADNSGDYNAGHRFGCFTTIIKNDGSVQTNIYALKNAANQSTGTAMGITCKSDGTQSWNCPSICEQKERRADVNNSIVRIYGGATNPSSDVWYQTAIELCGWENSTFPGWVVIHSGDGTVGRSLTLKPDGNLIWNGNKLYLSSHFLLEETSKSITLGYPYVDAIGGLIAFRSMTDSQNPGGFSIYAKTSAGQKVLVGKYEPDSLSWNGKEIERVDSSGTNWIRFVSGLQICWGKLAITLTANQAKTWSWTYPKPFSSTWDVVANWCSGHSTVQVGGVEAASNTACSGFWQNTVGGNFFIYVLAIGFWK